jgi:hypothetical protein
MNRQRWKRWGVRFALTVPFLLAFLLISEIFLRNNLQLLTGLFPCLSFIPKEGISFLPSCSAELPSPAGVVKFQSNEDGFRDRPRAFFSQGAVAILGDSHVEGFNLEEPDTLGRKLEASLGGAPFLNLGVRSSGPTLQAIKLFRALHHYPVKGVVWVLNPTDSYDEVYFYHENPGYDLSQRDTRTLRRHIGAFSPWRLAYSLSRILQHRIYTLMYVLDHFQLERAFAAIVTREPFQKAIHCAGIAHTAVELKKKGIPLVFLTFPHGAKDAGHTYFGLKPNAPDFQLLVECAKDTGSPVVEAHQSFSAKPEWFWMNDWHLNPAGMDAYAGLVKEDVAKALGASRGKGAR